jgi:hypothetical protein
MVFGGLEDEVDCSPIVCEPLCQLLPPGSPPVAVEVVKLSGEVEIIRSQKGWIGI